MRALLLLACIGCSARATTHEHANAPIANVAPTAVEPTIEPGPSIQPGPSIYELPIQLVDATGARIGLDVARGKPVLVSMFYASCSVACPLLISEVQQVLAELPPDADVRVLLVSFDPARDTAAKLMTLSRERKLDARWTLAVANATDARSLAAVLGVKYRQLPNGEFAHGSTIVALDGEGREIARTDSLGQRAALVRALMAYH
jgi:protein SCO1